jgi:hypothetical protein
LKAEVRKALIYYPTEPRNLEELFERAQKIDREIWGQRRHFGENGNYINRHNTDVSFLPTNSSGLAMIFYSTNYSTKLDAPLWKRAALMGAVPWSLRL